MNCGLWIVYIHMWDHCFQKWLDSILGVKKGSYIEDKKNSLLYNFCYWKNFNSIHRLPINNCTMLQTLLNNMLRCPKAIHQLRIWRILFFYIFGYQSKIMNISSVLSNTKDCTHRWYSFMNILKKIFHAMLFLKIFTYPKIVSHALY